MENRDLGHADTVIIHVGTNDVRRTRNLDYIMGEVYDLVTTAKEKFPGSRVVLSGVLRNKGVKWRQIGATNNRLEWVASSLGATFIVPNSWIRDADFGKDGLHLQIWSGSTGRTLLQNQWVRRPKPGGGAQLTTHEGTRVQCGNTKGSQNKEK